jgi:hypothetical protein
MYRVCNTKCANPSVPQLPLSRPHSSVPYRVLIGVPLGTKRQPRGGTAPPTVRHTQPMESRTAGKDLEMTVYNITIQRLKEATATLALRLRLMCQNRCLSEQAIEDVARWI